MEVFYEVYQQASKPHVESAKSSLYHEKLTVNRKIVAHQLIDAVFASTSQPRREKKVEKS